MVGRIEEKKQLQSLLKEEETSYAGNIQSVITAEELFR